MLRARWFVPALSTLAACASDPDTVLVKLSPSVISSLDGTTALAALVANGTQPLTDVPVHVTVVYTDRNGTAHAVAPLDGSTDARGVFHATVTGLKWDGTGTVTVQAAPAVGVATFAVLDRTPPTVTILPHMTNNHIGPNMPVDVQVHVTDEIGVSQVTLDATGPLRIGGGSVAILSGAQDKTVTFRLYVNDLNPPDGSPIALHALAADLSGNLQAAAPVALIVDQSIIIATPPGLTGSRLAAFTTTKLTSAHSIVFSKKDGHLYVADTDQSGTGACFPSCIWRVSTAGVIDATPVFTAPSIDGLAVDADGDYLYYSASFNLTGRLAWSGSAYAGAVVCNDAVVQRPRWPSSLVFDATLGLLVIDRTRHEVTRVATCATTTAGARFNVADLQQPTAIAAGASGEFYVSEANPRRVWKMSNTGVLTLFESNLAGAAGMGWLDTDASQFAGSLMVAASIDQTIESTRGAGSLAAAYFAEEPVDLTFDGSGAMYVITGPGILARGGIFKITGF